MAVRRQVSKCLTVEDKFRTSLPLPAADAAGGDQALAPRRRRRPLAGTAARSFAHENLQLPDPGRTAPGAKEPRRHGVDAATRAAATTKLGFVGQPCGRATCRCNAPERSRARPAERQPQRPLRDRLAAASPHNRQRLERHRSRLGRDRFAATARGSDRPARWPRFGTRPVHGFLRQTTFMRVSSRNIGAQRTPAPRTSHPLTSVVKPRGLHLAGSGAGVKVLTCTNFGTVA